MYQAIARSWPGISAVYAAEDDPPAKHIESEFKRYLKCGIIQYGFIRLQCSSCGHERVCGYSCKCRGFCSSCGAKRMEQTALRLEKEVWPQGVGARQFVLTFPHQVRHWLARSSELLSAVSSEVAAEISTFYELGASLGVPRDSIGERATGGVTFIQRFNSALTLSPHLHVVFMDGVFAETAEGRRFLGVQYFDSSSVILILNGIIKRLERLFRDWGYVTKDGEPAEPDLEGDVPLPFKPRAPKAYRKAGLAGTGRSPHPLYQNPDPDQMSVEGWCNVKFKWFSLHAGVAIKEGDRQGLLRLLRYTSRSSVSPSRLSYMDPTTPEESDLELTLKRAWSDGTSALRFTQTAFTEQIASLIPDPWHNQTRYHGIFAPGHAWRARIVPGPQKKTGCLDREHDMGPPKPTKPSSGRAAAEYVIPWAELLRKSFGIDPELCVCGAKMRITESVTEADQIAETMVVMGLASTPPPLGRARRVTGELDYVYEGE